MTETYKVLMYGQTFVDYGLLSKGVYGAKFPHLYSKDDTIESLIEFEKFKQESSCYFDSHLEDDYYKNKLKNLSQCVLKEVTLTIN